MKCMLWISRLILAASLMMNSAGISSAGAEISLSPTNGALSELGQSKKMDANAQAKAESAYAKRPLSFEANKGQTDASVKFLARGKGYTLFLTPSEAVLALQSPASSKAKGDVVRMSLKGANANPLVQGLDILPSKSNYIKGNDQKKWQNKVEQYSKVEYKQVYKGIDVVYYGNQGQLEYDFVVAPGANPGLIKMNFQGAKNLKLDKQGNLVLNLKEGQLAFNAPILYQKTGDTREPVEGRFVLAGNKQVCFKVGDYDKSKELIIDPSITYSTYLGTTVEDRVNAIAVDAAGNVYMTGQTTTVADKFPGNLAYARFQASNGGAIDAFVLKLNPAGDILWVTYYGGVADDIGLGIAVDGTNIGGNGPRVFITGSTTGTLPATTPAYTQLGTGGGTDAFIACFSGDGTALVYANEFGCPQIDSGNGIAVDASGNAYVAGFTGSTANNSFPIYFAGASMVAGSATPAQSSFGQAGDGFVCKFNAAGTIQYSTYLGGTGIDQANAIAIDSTGNAYVTGYCHDTFVSAVPPFDVQYANVFRNTLNSAGATDIDAFIVKLNPTGADFVYKTYVGGSGLDYGTGIALDSLNNVYITGDSMSADMPNVGSTFARIGQTTNAGNPDAFVFKMKTAFTGLNDGIYFTYLGGSGIDRGFGIAVDPAFNAYVTGTTESPDFISVGAGAQPALPYTDAAKGGTSDAFVAVIADGGVNPRLFNTYLGGVTLEEGKGIALDTGNNIYVAGWTSSGLSGEVYPTAFPTVLPRYADRAGDKDGFVMKISPVSVPVLPTITSLNPNRGTTAGATSVIIYGTGFTGTSGVTGVKFGAVNAASYVVNTSTMITAVSPAQVAGLVDIRVTSPAGTTLNVLADDYTYTYPVITGVMPPGGVLEGGTLVVITGTGFTGVTSVKFDVTPAVFTVDSNTQITSTSPAHAVGEFHIIATSPEGSSLRASSDPDFMDDIYTYFSGASAPTITSVNPPGGSSDGGTTVVITGTGFTDVNAPNGVKFGAVNATSYTVNYSTQITAISPAALIAGTTVDIRVTSLDGISPIVSDDLYTYFVAVSTIVVPPSAPTITSVIPAGGIPAGGTTVVITGTGFTGITAASGVKFGSKNATSYTVNTSSQITAISPAALVAGTTVDIRVTSLNGVSPIVTEDIYTYFLELPVTPAPSVTGLNPALGTSLGGTTVIITGTGFSTATITAANGVKFGEFNADSYVVNSNMRITAVTKAHAIGIVDVVVTSLNGISPVVLASKYTYFLTPVTPLGVVEPFKPYIFPSPTRGNTAQLAYFMQGPGIVDFRIYNEIGELVKYLLDESKPAGVNGSSINTGKMAPGVYYCLVNINYDDGTKKHYKLKFVVTH